MRDGDGGFGLGDGRCVCGGAGLELGKGRRCVGRGWRRQLGRAEGLQVRGGRGQVGTTGLPGGGGCEVRPKRPDRPGLEDTTGARGAGPGRPAGGAGGRGPEWLQVRKRGPQVSSGQRVSEGSRGEGNAAFSSAGIFFFFFF